MKRWFEIDTRIRDKAEESEGSSGKAEESSEEESSEENDEGEESGEESEDEENEESEEELNADQLKEAKNLYKLLSDKKTQVNTLRILAQEAGILGSDGEKPPTKKEEKAVIKSTVELLEKHLGKDLAWLAPKLAAAFDEMREDDRASNKKELETIKQTQVAREVDQAFETLARETKGMSRKFESKITALADKLYPSPEMSVMEYVRQLYTLASAQGGGKSNKQQLADKINRNSKDVPGRLSDSSASGGGKGRESGQKVSLKDAVAMALEKQIGKS